MKTQIEGGFVSVDDGEAVAIESFKQDWFIRFESLGAPSVEAATESGELSKGALKQFATEWLLSKEESRKDESLSISRKALAASVEANSLAAVASRKAERANNIAIMAIICSAAAALIAAWITVKFGK
ncbi:hypothetical protein CAP31_03060 [Sulfuriferula sp. AH1]|nr:hypothetical protein CAP31_03060 [Sulfuriferula sp. AH1]